MEKSENYKNLFYQAMRIRLVEEKIIERALNHSVYSVFRAELESGLRLGL